MSELQDYTDQQLFLIEDFEFEVPCESNCCAEYFGKDAHPADWAVLISCGHGDNWCQERFHFYVQVNLPEVGGIWCNMCHSEFPGSYDEKVIGQIPIRGHRNPA